MNEIIKSKQTIKLKKEVDLYFKNKALQVFNKKKPSGKEYSYKVHNSDNVIGLNSGYDWLYLVGNNWLKNNNQNIALMVGFNDWKLGFTADYLPEYRTAFLPRNKMSFLDIHKLKKLKHKPSVIIVWGYTESQHVTRYAKKNNLPIYRMEDAFIRSAKLGAQHATPYSLILDKTGFYYNCYEPSDIENILNTYDFKADTALMQNAQECIKLIKELRLSKYNLPRKNVEGVNQNIKLRKRVAVLGQVDGDASIRLGNPDNWTSEELIKLAIYENPNCEIFYRPHPEVYQGFQNSKFKAQSVEKYATITTPDENIIDFIEAVDHVYTISSLSGFEAVIRNKKVTTVGAPFYSGWGVTDDRVTIKRRTAKLSIEEVFAGTYLLYPRYLGDHSNIHTGFLAAAYRICAEREIEEHKYYKAISVDKENDKYLLSTNFWPMYFFTNNYTGKDFDSAINDINFSDFLFGANADLFKSTLLHAVYGKLNNHKSKELFLHKVRSHIEYHILNDFLLRAIKIKKEAVLISNLSWLLSEVGDIDDAIQVMSACDDIEENDTDILPPIISNNSLQLDILKNSKQFNESLDLAFYAMLNNEANSGLFLKVAQIAELTFDWKSVAKLSTFMQHINWELHNRAAVHMGLENIPTDRALDKKNLFIQLAKQLIQNPDRLNRTTAIVKHFFDNDFPLEVFLAILNLDNAQTHQKVIALIETGKVEQASHLIQNLLSNNPITDKLLVTYSKVLFEEGKYDEVEDILMQAINIEPSHANYTELLRLLKFQGRFSEAIHWVSVAKEQNIKLTDDGHIMPIYFGLKKIELGFKCFLQSAVREKLVSYFGNDKYKESESLDADDLFLICSFGPAEEVRFASVYNEISSALGNENFKISCEPRLLEIFSRSFPNIRFIPVTRARNFNPNIPRELFDKTPGSDLVNILDNTGYKVAKESKQIKLLSELLWHFRKNYKDFPVQDGYLKTNHDKNKLLAERLPKNKTLVGIGWRSQLTNSQRNIHYLTIQELEPLFKIKNITFVNLQYDNCNSEISWVEERYPGKLINLDDIDQYNDFDSVLSLMENLDMVIAPCTVTTDLAGAIGCPTIYLSTHGEILWRMKDEENTDVWFDSMKHVFSPPGNKKVLVQELCDKLENWKNEQTKNGTN
ncbi:hypothetical protein Q4506_06935 [Colwellia sp. 4_MG-2023]|uniref:capsular polysaccharide export protein, LipB/KpsS family n=1 Tax=unclassified Colwellia TaxID=196834 RepID=UPI0026E36F24|nr:MULTISPECIES: hypothetical protein [unclassified Colwellia]MDO6507247.1 hypothetical protein [Colwellia sp. 5_MG-2023]MDO6555409.1 hypothetical protein [Colwellia sp. 4_MG-2023]